MMRSLYSGVSGLRNHQTRMDVIGNNISNVNTVGFKASRVIFKDIFSQTTRTASAANEGFVGGTNPQQIGLGMTMSTIDVLHTRSASQYTGNTLDLMIDGDGFFAVKDPSGQTLFTRAGNFYTDEANQLVTGDGYLVQGYQKTPIMEWMKIPKLGTNGEITLVAEGTDGMAALAGGYRMGSDGKLILVESDGSTDAAVAIAPIEVRDGGIKVDSTGNPILKQAVDAKGNLLYMANEKPIMVPVYQGDPVMDTTSTPAVPLTVAVERATADGIVKIEYLAPGDTGYTEIPVHARDEATGELLYNNAGQRGRIVIDPDLYYNVSIDKNGIITGIDKKTQLITQIGQLEIATFTNQTALEKLGSNLYAETTNSGEAVFSKPGENGAGIINPGTLEMSNVDLANEFTDMIVTQRGFQANSRIITTSDSMLEELVNLKR